MKDTPNRQEKLKGLEQAQSCVCFNLRSTSRAITQFYNAGLHASGLLATQFSLLAALASRERSTPMTTLAETLGMDRTTLARNLRPLQRNRLIDVAPDANDRRIQLVGITQEGLDKLAFALPLWRHAQQHILERFGHDRWKALMGDLTLISESTRTAK